MAERHGISNNRFFSEGPYSFYHYGGSPSDVHIRKDNTYHYGVAMGGLLNGYSTQYRNGHRFDGITLRGQGVFGTRSFQRDNATRDWHDQRSFSIEYNQDSTFFCGYVNGPRKVGPGLRLHPSGSITCGTFSNGTMEGRAISISPNGTFYVGCVSSQGFQGYGEMNYLNYSSYKGSWFMSQYDGYGVLTVHRYNNRREYLLRKWSHVGTWDIIHPGPLTSSNPYLALLSNLPTEELKKRIKFLIKLYKQPTIIKQEEDTDSNVISEQNLEQELILDIC